MYHGLVSGIKESVAPVSFTAQMGMPTNSNSSSRSIRGLPRGGSAGFCGPSVGLVLVTGASDRDFPAELHQVDIDGTAAMTKSNRRRDVSVRLASHHPGIGGTFTANLADKILALQLQHAHEKAPRFIQKKPRLDHNSSRGCRYCFSRQGNMTESITWITPLVAMISVCTTRALSTMTLPSLVSMRSARPLTVGAEVKLTTSPAVTRPGTTW
jgi:hypothetical protein